MAFPSEKDWQYRQMHIDGAVKAKQHKTFPGPFIINSLIYLSDTEKHGGGTVAWPGAHKAVRALAESDRPGAETGPENARPKERKRKPQKLSYQLQRELDALPDQIEAAEQELARLQNQVSEPEFYTSAVEKQRETFEAIRRIEVELAHLVNRWGELEELSQQAAGS